MPQRCHVVPCLWIRDLQWLASGASQTIEPRAHCLSDISPPLAHAHNSPDLGAANVAPPACGVINVNSASHAGVRACMLQCTHAYLRVYRSSLVGLQIPASMHTCARTDSVSHVRAAVHAHLHTLVHAGAVSNVCHNSLWIS